jgi:RNA polymerase sigma-70 factor (ECF subfamily)
MTREGLDDQLLRHHEDSFGWALHCAGYDRTEAEEVLQQAYLKVLDGRARFAGRSAFRTWLFGVIRRTAGERRRAHAIRSLFLERWHTRTASETSPADDPLAMVVRDASARELVRALERLSARQRDLLHLVFYQDLTIEQAAEAMGLRLGTARTHYERGKARLRDLLGANWGKA